LSWGFERCRAIHRRMLEQSTMFKVQSTFLALILNQRSHVVAFQLLPARQKLQLDDEN
jgi:hypothetical protein